MIPMRRIGLVLGASLMLGAAGGNAASDKPHIDRIAREGMAFTDYYAMQSCTPGSQRLLHRHVPPAHRDDPATAEAGDL